MASATSRISFLKSSSSSQLMSVESVRITPSRRGAWMRPTAAATVFVIDDDDLVRAAIQGMLKSVGLRSETCNTKRVLAQ